MATHRQHRVLVVDDDSDLRDLLADRLRLRHFEVDCAGNGEEALGILRQGPSADHPA